jgi:hypothetical protein
MQWIRSQNKRISLPQIEFNGSDPSLIFIRACPGHPFNLTLDDLKRPSISAKQTLRLIRHTIEGLSETAPPDVEKCRPFLEMVCNDALHFREEMFGGVALGGTQCIVHGDLNPSNIIIEKDQISLIDWEHWRIGGPFENWFDFVIRSIWFAARGKIRDRPKDVLGLYRELLQSSWIREETELFFERFAPNSSVEACLRYCLFLFLIDGIIKIEPKELKNQLEEIRLCKKT